jgi:hypothetical protein
VRFYVSTAPSVKMAVLWDVMPYSLVHVDQCLRGVRCLHHPVDEGCKLLSKHWPVSTRRQSSSRSFLFVSVCYQLFRFLYNTSMHLCQKYPVGLLLAQNRLCMCIVMNNIWIVQLWDLHCHVGENWYLSFCVVTGVLEEPAVFTHLICTSYCVHKFSHLMYNI